MAWLTMENMPEITAWPAMMLASVAMITSGISKADGTMAKKAFVSLAPFSRSQADCPK